MSKSFRGTTVSWISHEWQAWISNVCKFGTGSCQPERGEEKRERSAPRIYFTIDESNVFLFFSLSLFPLFLTRGVRLRVNETKGNENNNNNNNNNNRENVVFDVTFQLIRDLVEHGGEGEKERRGWNNNRGKWREWEKKERKDKNRQIRNRVIIEGKGEEYFACD